MCWQKMLGQLQEHRAGGRGLKILGDATEKTRSTICNAMHANRMANRLVMEDVTQRAGL